MLVIKWGSKKDSTEWSQKEWAKVSLPHFGKDVKWKERSFRYTAFEDGNSVGYISGKCQMGVLYIGQVITKEEARGKGVGKALVKKAEEFGKKCRAHMTWLFTGKNWEENLFYKKIGFKLSATLHDFYLHQDFVIYTRPIK